MTLTPNERRVLEYFYHNRIGGVSLYEVYKKLNLDGTKRGSLGQRLVDDGLIKVLDQTDDQVYYKITEYGIQVHESLY